MRRSDLVAAATLYHREYDRYGLSLSTWPGSTAEEIAMRPGGPPHSMMRASTVRRLRQAGFDLEPTGRPGHVTLYLPDPPTEEDWERLEQAFGPAVPNPAARPMGRR